MDDAATLGQRIVWAARLAVVAHFSEQCMQTMRQQEQAPGGAGANISKDGASLALPLADDGVPPSSAAERRAG